MEEQICQYSVMRNCKTPYLCSTQYLRVHFPQASFLVMNFVGLRFITNVIYMYIYSELLQTLYFHGLYTDHQTLIINTNSAFHCLAVHRKHSSGSALYIITHPEVVIFNDSGSILYNIIIQYNIKIFSVVLFFFYRLLFFKSNFHIL